MSMRLAGAAMGWMECLRAWQDQNEEDVAVVLI